MKNDDGYIDDIDGLSEEKNPGAPEGNVIFEFIRTEPPQWEADIEKEGIRTYEHAARYVTGFMKKEFEEKGSTLNYEAMNDPEGSLSPAELAAALCFMEQEQIEKTLYHERNSFRNMRKINERLRDIEKRLKRLQ
ncbi:MAG: hypothetical protein J5685_07360 [Clostridiales bacterium]|nr:hypothetical protein [Clostridiales bacterium]